MQKIIENSPLIFMRQLKGLLRTMRPKQWIPKNGIVFASLVLSEKGLLLQPEAILRATAAFMIFVMISSVAYILNDIIDIEKDRTHPTKRNRPLPSGQLSVSTALLAMVALLLLALTSAFNVTLLFGAVVLLYFVNNIFYNFALKKMVILDVFSIAAGFVLRALGGALAVDVEVSPWLYVLTVLFSLFLGISKRRHEILLLNEGRGAFRQVLTQYSAPMLEEMLSVVTASTVIAYSIYTFSAESMPDNHTMMLTIPFVIYGIFRYLYLVHSGADAPPDEILLKDKPMIVTICLWMVTVLIILYGFGERIS